MPGHRFPDSGTPRWLPLETWPRRAAFEYFRGLAKPWFSVCARLDLTALYAARHGLGPNGLTLAYHHAVLRAANALQPFRLRLQDGRVRLHETIHGSMTVLRPDETIAFAHIDHVDDFAAFARAASPRLQAAQRGEVAFDAGLDDDACIHFTTLPWLDFTSFEHARGADPDDAVPKIAFGKIVPQGGRRTMAIAIEVHHALIDGLHVGRLVQDVQALLDGWGSLEPGSAKPPG
ncbi:MAG: hypothetical protein HY021_12040 [Burkholderiales bacterium]|nr:hypothetical protein [Burkholderiales bacterium]